MSNEITKTDLDRARDKARTITAYHRVFSTPEGELVMEDIRRAFGVHMSAFVSNDRGRFDPIHAAIRDGQRQVILHIESILKTTKPDGDGNVEKPSVKILTEQPNP